MVNFAELKQSEFYLHTGHRSGREDYLRVNIVMVMVMTSILEYSSIVHANDMS
jgi:hypothetical protein